MSGPPTAANHYDPYPENSMEVEAVEDHSLATDTYRIRIPGGDVISPKSCCLI